MQLLLRVNVILSTLLFVCINIAFGQKEANIWYFGRNAGLDFNSGYPVALRNSAMVTHGASAVISDQQSGMLQFYSNGEKIWNRNHDIMYNGDDILGTLNADQGALIVPNPGNQNEFYLFTIKVVYDQGNTSNLYYSVIDISIDNGLGGVTTKNVLLLSDVTQSQIAVKNNAGNGYWLVAHQANTNAFISIAVLADGLSSPQEYSIGSIYLTGSSRDAELKFSPDGTMIAGGPGGVETTNIELFDFDDTNGNISNYRLIGSLGARYGTSFSPDNSKLYISGTDISYLESSADIGDYIYQFDLSSPSLQAIKDSKLPLFSANNTVTNVGRFSAVISSGIQIGPDGKIYAAGNITTADETGSIIKSTRNALFVIERPNVKGYECYITLVYFDFGDGGVFPGLPNFVQSTFNLRVPPDDESRCNSSDGYSVFPNPVKNSFQIRAPLACFEPYHFTLYNSLGQLVKEGFVYTRESDFIDVHSLANGNYLLRLQLQRNSIVKKVIKE